MYSTMCHVLSTLKFLQEKSLYCSKLQFKVIEDEVQRLFRQENNREGRKLNVVAYGIPQQPGVLNDYLLIKRQLAELYSITSANTSNIRHLVVQPLPVDRPKTSPQPSTPILTRGDSKKLPKLNSIKLSLFINKHY